jgi:hypothetical protein
MDVVGDVLLAAAKNCNITPTAAQWLLSQRMAWRISFRDNSNTSLLP